MIASTVRLVSIVAAAALVVAVLWTARSTRDRIAFYEREVQTLEDQVRRLSYNTASGGGVNVKLMPDAATGQATVPLEEVFSFDRNHAICRVDTNPQAFRMRTYQRGEVIIEPHRFFMAMIATTIDKFEITSGPGGTRRVIMRGGLSCSTEVGQGKVRLGSRTAAEHATYLIEAADKGPGGGKAGDTFAFTAFFDSKKAPVNYSIFGPRFTFTGKMVEGEITITDPRQ